MEFWQLSSKQWVGSLKRRQTEDYSSSIVSIVFSESRNSAFFATLSTTVVFEDAHQLILFNTDKINEGGHYNATSGIYTAPVTGIYQFFAYIRAEPYANFNFYIDSTLTYANPIENSVSQTQAEGTSVLVRLQAGQTVHIGSANGPQTIVGSESGTRTYFGGHLLYPDLD